MTDQAAEPLQAGSGAATCVAWGHGSCKAPPIQETMEQVGLVSVLLLVRRVVP